MQIGLGKCPACRESLSYEARLCPHCGQPFDRYGSFGGYLLAMEREQERREAERERIRRQEALHRLLFILATIVVVVIIIAAFLLFHGGGSGFLGATGLDAGGAVQTPTPVTVTAKNTIQHYYDDVNNQNYVDAYYTWDRQGESLADFQSGYSNTKHDGLVFGDVVSQADGTVKVNVTIYATELTASGGTRLSTYKGYYIMGKRGNEWKILYGTLNHT